MTPTQPGTQMAAKDLQVGDTIVDRSLAGTHAQRIIVEWVRHYDRRSRTYVSGVGETYGDPVQLGYDDAKLVETWRS